MTVFPGRYTGRIEGDFVVFLIGSTLCLMPMGPSVVQYWRSFEHLERFARNPELAHLPAWKRFNRAVGGSGDVGIWHET